MQRFWKQEQWLSHQIATKSFELGKKSLRHHFFLAYVINSFTVQIPTARQVVQMPRHHRHVSLLLYTSDTEPVRNQRYPS